ncbi:MAG: hypothetical protein HC769_35605 [Cyanobacteria bacterium CRU_2_1]|nr:hypothetical protein [Cyanobacteria bacterium CRU_2_1]
MATTSTQYRRKPKKNSRQPTIEGVNQGLEVQPVLGDSDSLSEGVQDVDVDVDVAPASPPETGDYVYGQTIDGEKIFGFVQSVGKQYLKLMDGRVQKMEIVQVLQRLPKSLELFAEWIGNGLIEQLDHLFEEYAFYNLSSWNHVTNPADLDHFWDHQGWSIDFYKTIEVNISKHDQNWYLELNKMPELKGNGDILEYCKQAIDHAEGVVAAITEYEQQAIALQLNQPMTILMKNPKSFTLK